MPGGGSKPGERRGGRKKGSQNKLTVKIKEALDKCYKKIGGDKRFAEWADENPTEFFKLWGKQIPRDVEVSGKEGQPVILKIVEQIIGEPVSRPAPRLREEVITANGHS